MKIRIIPLFAAVLFLLALATLGCGGDEQPAARADAAPAAAPAFGLGSQAPDFALKDVHGQEVRLSALRGKAVVVDFWATWCGPCRAVMPHLQALSEAYPEGLEIVAVSLDQDPSKVVPAFIEQMGLTFTVLADTGAVQVARQWGGIRSIPTSFLIDRDGVVVHRWEGAHGREVYETEIRKVLGQGV